MVKNSRNNLIIVGFDNQRINQICVLLTNYMDLYFLSLEDLIEYSLMDRIEMNQVCGVDYIVKRENSIIKTLGEYENSLINPGLERFIQNSSKFDDMAKVFILPKSRPKDVVDNIVFDERKKILTECCDITIKDCRDDKKIVEEIIKFYRG